MTIRTSADGTQTILQVGGVDKLIIDSGGIASGYKDASVEVAKLAASAKPSGVDQTWQSVAASRAIGVTYTNTTGRPIHVSITLASNAGNSGGALSVGGLTVSIGYAVFNTNNSMVSAIVPPGATYSLVQLAGTLVIGGWAELR